jgi:hypothetical protein
LDAINPTWLYSNQSQQYVRLFGSNFLPDECRCILGSDTNTLTTPIAEYLSQEELICEISRTSNVHKKVTNGWIAQITVLCGGFEVTDPQLLMVKDVFTIQE